jgi:hypothetical protein
MTTGEGGPVFSKAKHPNQSDYIQPLVKIWSQVKEDQFLAKQSILRDWVYPTNRRNLTTGIGGPVFSQAKHLNQTEYIQPTAKKWPHV